MNPLSSLVTALPRWALRGEMSVHTLVAALPRWVLRGEIVLCAVCVFCGELSEFQKKVTHG